MNEIENKPIKLNDIENKLIELWGMLSTVPNECKGSSPIASKFRRRWMDIRMAIHGLIDE